MNVKDLITELLDYDLGTTVDIGIYSAQEDDDFESFEFDENGNYLSLVVNLKDYLLVSKSDFEEMQKEIEELKNQVEELESEHNDN